MPVDIQRIESFLNENPVRRQVASICRRIGFDVVWVISYHRELWGFHLKSNRHLRDLLDTSREVLVWVAEYPDFQARAVLQAQEIIERSRPRLSEDFCLIFTGDPESKRRVEEATFLLQTHFVGFSLSELVEFQPHGTRDFLRELQTRFYSKDLYYLSTAITSQSAFFGRDHMISEILAALKHGSTHIGVFGLRKMGKTSLLYRLIDHIKSTKSILYCHLDIQRIDAINPRLDYLLWSIGEELMAANRVPPNKKPFRMFGRYSAFADIKSLTSVVEDFDHDLKLLLDASKRKILLFLDEIELMSPEAPCGAWGDTYVRFWRLLRGLSQQYRGQLGFFVTGTNPRCIEVNRLGGAENPIYNFFKKYYLPPLCNSEAWELLDKLGYRMGLEWREEAKARLYALTGGHPFLLRAFASKVHRTLLPRQALATIELDTVTKLVSGFLIEMNSAFSQMIEVFEGQYQDELILLNTLAEGSVFEFREMAAAFPDDVAHLIGFGLISEDLASAAIVIELLHSWMQRRQKRRSSAPRESVDRRYSSGETVEGYTIQSLVSDRGGFGTVYLASQQQEGTPGRGKVALKVLRSGSLERLQREVEALSAVRHSGLVAILDYGATIRKELFIAMEYLEGGTLAQFCSRATRLAPSYLVAHLRSVLLALSELHPDDEKVERYRKRSELTLSELRELTGARHGFIHRDIKPENIILVAERGPVLIDFGISVRIAEPVRTLSATPGYLPPDGIVGGRWTADIDLFQLGVTFLQVGTGYPFDGDNLGDLRSVCKEELPDRISRVLLAMTERSIGDRIASARNALRMLS